MKCFRFMATLATALVFAACSDVVGSGGDDSLHGGDVGGGGTLNGGDKESYTADGVSFAMAYVPGGLTFPKGVNDEGAATVTDAYWIGETEVTYELWQKVYAWAIDTARGANQYHFDNEGTMGGKLSGGGFGTNQHPVTTVDWQDSVAWCNALTEWYNAQNGANLDCVYTCSGAVFRDSRHENCEAFPALSANSGAKGFRLLSINEYELAARYIDGSSWTYGDHATGDNSGACYDDGSILGGLGISTVIGDYVVYYGTGSSTTAAVKSKKPNALGLYDMSGNVWEFCFDYYGTGHYIRGGFWYSDANPLRVGYSTGFGWPNQDSGVGFRLARTQ